VNEQRACDPGPGGKAAGVWRNTHGNQGKECQQRMIIDCHVHLNNYHEQEAVSLDESLDRLEAAMEEAGVAYSLVLTSYIVSIHRPSTAEVVRGVQRYDNLGVVAGISYNNYRERDLRELADFLRTGEVKGLKLYPGYEPFYPHDPRLRVVYDLAEEFDVPVMIHSGDTFTPKGKVRTTRSSPSALAARSGTSRTACGSAR
jgi:predicted TIM-barrel fold metal-dependent hydrolase